MQREASLLVFLLLTGCSDPAAPTRLPSTAERLAPPESPPAHDLGVARVVMPTADAEALYRTALRAHHLGDHTASLEGFTAALEASPGYAMARFHQACALTRLGRDEEAEALLTQLFEEDLPTFAHRFLNDEDLATLRDGASGVRLRAHLEALLPRMQAIWARGALAYVHAPYPEEPGGRSVLGLSMGVIDPVTNRFVAIAPRANDALGMQLDREANVAFVLHGRVRQGTFWSTYFVPEEVEVFDLSRPFDRVLQVSVLALMDGAHELPSITVQATREHVDIGLDHIDRAPRGESSVRFRITSAGREVLAQPFTPSTGTLWIRSDQGSVERVAPPSSQGLRFENGALIRDAEGTRPGVRITLGARHQSPRLELSPDGTRVFVRSESVRCSNAGRGLVYRSAFDLVNLASERVTPIETGQDDLLFEGRFAADGTFYFQAGEALRRYAPQADQPALDVPANVVLTTHLMAWKVPINCAL